ncbi:transposase [Candidatus Collinsella stercoripullorum]|uniref:transposase n=1 Tax=Candidatus Collinsella stercoripullorum TaxID=2838522 RepID=UPI0022DEB182|nr:transposase [Candidatus Collinsella stercoripullorum]
MEIKPRHYSKQFKRETAERVIASGKPVKVAARELNLPPSTLQRWVTDYRGGARPAARPAADGSAAALRMRVRELEDENALLMKLVAHFTKRAF